MIVLILFLIIFLGYLFCVFIHKKQIKDAKKDAWACIEKPKFPLLGFLLIPFLFPQSAIATSMANVTPIQFGDSTNCVSDSTGITSDPEGNSYCYYNQNLSSFPIDLTFTFNLATTNGASFGVTPTGMANTSCMFDSSSFFINDGWIANHDSVSFSLTSGVHTGRITIDSSDNISCYWDNTLITSGTVQTSYSSDIYPAISIGYDTDYVTDISGMGGSPTPTPTTEPTPTPTTEPTPTPTGTTPTPTVTLTPTPTTIPEPETVSVNLSTEIKMADWLSHPLTYTPNFARFDYYTDGTNGGVSLIDYSHLGTYSSNIISHSDVDLNLKHSYNMGFGGFISPSVNSAEYIGISNSYGGILGFKAKYTSEATITISNYWDGEIIATMTYTGNQYHWYNVQFDYLETTSTDDIFNASFYLDNEYVGSTKINTSKARGNYNKYFIGIDNGTVDSISYLSRFFISGVDFYPDEKGVCLMPTKLTITNLNIGSWLGYYWCLFKDWFGKTLAYLFVPNSFDSDAFNDVATTFKGLITTKAPISYLYEPINHVDWEEFLTSTPTESDLQFEIPIESAKINGVTQKFQVDLNPPDSLDNYISWYMGIMRVVIAIPFIFDIFWLGYNTFHFTEQSDDTVEYNEWQNTHKN